MAGSIWIWTILIFLVVCSSSTAVEDLSVHRDDRVGRFHRDTRGILLRSWRNLQQNEEKTKSDGGYHGLLDNSVHFLSGLPISMKINLLQRISEHEKRALKNDAFLGMRGKKKPSNWLGLPANLEGFMEDEHRNEQVIDHVTHDKVKKPNGGRFMGMRGKKIPTNFYGVRGKKVSDKFLGMRGKKSYVFTPLKTEKKILWKNPTDSQLPKRIPVGPYNFVGMRGKKSFNTNITNHDDQDEEEETFMDSLSSINELSDQDLTVEEKQYVNNISELAMQQQNPESADQGQNIPFNNQVTESSNEAEFNGEWLYP